MTDVALRFGATDDGLTAQFRKVNRQLDDFQRQANRAASAIGLNRSQRSINTAR